MARMCVLPGNLCDTPSGVRRPFLCHRASELTVCATALHAFHVKASRGAPAEAKTAIYEKYAQHRYHSVAVRLNPPLDLPPHLFEDPESCMEL